MIQLYQKNNTLKVLSFFFNDPYNGYYLREMARELRMDPMTTKRALDILTKDGLLVRYHEKNMILYKGAIEQPHFTFAKVSYSLSLIRDSGLVEKILDQMEGVISIVLYGSIAKGEDEPDSDLDLLIISNTKKMELREISHFSREINPVIISLGNWSKQAKDNRAFYMEILRYGIELYGKIPVME